MRADQRLRLQLTVNRASARGGPLSEGTAGPAHWTLEAPMDLSNVDRGHLDELCRRYGIARIDVFGSVARGEDREGSDVDLLYELRSGAGSGGISRRCRTSWRTCSAARSIWCPVERCILDCVTASSPRPAPYMRRDELLLAKMIEAAEQAIALTTGTTTEDLAQRVSGGNRRGCATGSCTATGPSTSTSCTRPALRQALAALEKSDDG